MEEKTCYYCGTRYPKDKECCPLCGQKETIAEEIDEIPADFKPTVQSSLPEEETYSVPRRRRKKRKNLFATLLCVILALSVIACTLWILHTIGILSFRPAPTDDTSLNLPVETDNMPENPPITAILAEPENIHFSAAGQKKRLHISYVSEDSSAADPAVPITYLSADPAVAFVSEDGEVTAVAEGETTITAQYAQFTAECSVICDFDEIEPAAPDTTEDPSRGEADGDPSNEPPAESTQEVSLSTTDFTLFSAGEKAKITVRNAPSGAETAWSSKNESIATVSGGVVTAVAPGTTTVTANVGGKTLSCIVRCRFSADSEPIVTQTSDGVSLSHEDVTLRRPDETFQIRLLSGDTGLSNVTWSTTNASVCTVDADGTVHAVGTGTAKIVAAYNGSSYSCIVRCSF